MFESSLDFLFIVALNGDILDVNEIAVNTLGYSKNTLLAMNITDIIIDEEFDQVSYHKKEFESFFLFFEKYPCAIKYNRK